MPLEEALLKVALRHSPILYMDRREPFFPSRVAVTFFSSPTASPSFPRVITIPQGADYVVEFAIWWDWDIQHLYELEHVWVAAEEGGKVVAVEASWHGTFHRFPHWKMESTHPVVYCQPGKHAFAHDPSHFPRWSTWYACTIGAGSMGLLVKDMFAEVLTATATEDTNRLIRKYLRQCAFVPTFRFTKKVVFPPEIFTDWESLRTYIPERVKAVISELREKFQVTEGENYGL